LESGGHLWSTYLGGSYIDYGYGIGADGAGHVLVTGMTNSPDWTSGGFDTSYNGYGGAFVAKLSGLGVPAIKIVATGVLVMAIESSRELELVSIGSRARVESAATVKVFVGLGVEVNDRGKVLVKFTWELENDNSQLKAAGGKKMTIPGGMVIWFYLGWIGGG
jgi:hypothetical protein